MPRCVIIGAGPVDPEQKELFLPGDYVIACDAGYRNAAALGVAPDLIVGDFDSAPRPEAENLVVLPAEKDDTDTHYAARLAVEKGFDEALILGVLGGARLDHSLAAIAAGLWLAKTGAESHHCGPGRGAALCAARPPGAGAPRPGGLFLPLPAGRRGGGRVHHRGQIPAAKRPPCAGRHPGRQQRDGARRGRGAGGRRQPAAGLRPEMSL